MLDAEQISLEASVIGSLMYHASAGDRGFANQLIDRWRLRPQDFTHPLLFRTYEAMQSMHREGKPPAFLALRQRIEMDREQASELLRLSIDGQKLYYETMGHDLRSQGGYVKLLAAMEQIRGMGASGHHISEGLKFLREQIDDIQDREVPVKRSPSMGDVSKQLVENIQDGVCEETLHTGSDSLTRALCGYRRGELIIMAGRPSMGKSMVAQSLGLQMARRGHGVLMFGLEMSKEEYGCRTLSDLSFSSTIRVEHRDIRSQNIGDRQIEAVAYAAAMSHDWPFIVCDRRGMTVDDIQAEIRRCKRSMEKDGKTLDAVIVDHLGHVRDSGRYRDSKNNQVGEITSGLLRVAKDLDVAVIAVCQLNRQTENRDNKRPQLSDLRDSGNIEQDANAVIFVYREVYYIERMAVKDDNDAHDRDTLLANARNKIELIIAKSRSGPTEKIDMFCDPGCNVIRDLEAHHERL